MGCSDSKQKDIYKFLVSKYTQQKVKQFIVRRSKVQFIESSKEQIVNILSKKLSNLKGQLLGQIDRQKVQIEKKYERSINRIEQANPKALQKAEKVHKAQLQQLMGFNEVMKKVFEFKNQCKMSLQSQQSQATHYISNYLNRLQEQQIKSIPQIKKFQGLEDDQQQKFLKTGKQKNKSSVQKGLTEIQSQIQQNCNFQNFASKLQNIVTKQKLRQLEAFAQKAFMAGQQKVKGASDCRTC